jgi:2-amino-4-hydroxy-6-hydroxymethyldihydropteridine diphosphokinase
MNIVYLLIGGNMGDRWQYLESCRNLLEFKVGNLFINSHVYETKAWGKENQNDFLNQVIGLKTPLDAASLLKETQNIETKLGRQRTDHWGSRTIDIDILFFNDEVIIENHLHIPHPQIQNRRFTLVPLNEIASDMIHPLLHKYIWQLLESCNDPLEVSAYKE